MFCNCQSFSSFRLMSTLLDHQMNLSHFLKLFCSLLLRFNHCIFNFSCLFRIQLLFASITSPFTMLICLLFISSFLFYIFVLKTQTSPYNIDLQSVIYVRYSATMWNVQNGSEVKSIIKLEIIL